MSQQQEAQYDSQLWLEIHNGLHGQVSQNQDIGGKETENIVTGKP